MDTLGVCPLLTKLKEPPWNKRLKVGDLVWVYPGSGAILPLNTPTGNFGYPIAVIRIISGGTPDYGLEFLHPQFEGHTLNGNINVSTGWWLSRQDIQKYETHLTAKQILDLNLETHMVPKDAFPRTQKCKGLYAIKNSYDNGSGGLISLFAPLGAGFISAFRAKDFTALKASPYISFPKFARPCPLTPKHGWIESRVVHNMAEALAVAREAADAEDTAEIIFMEPHTDAEYSAVITDTMACLGPGHDGATQGKDCVTLSTLDGNLLEAIGLNKGIVGMTQADACYLETVKNIPVQLRGGPKLREPVKVYIPNHVRAYKGPLKVGSVIGRRETGLQASLVDWDNLLTKKIKGNLAGTKRGRPIVIHLPGNTLSSHWSVQAIAKGFVVDIQNDRPSVGSLIEATTTLSELWDPDFISILKAAYKHSELMRRRWKDGCIVGISALQGGTQWRSGFPLFLLLTSFCHLIWAAYAACEGEHRHFNDQITKATGDLPMLRIKGLSKTMKKAHQSPTRETIFVLCEKGNLFSPRTLYNLNYLYHDFLHPGFNGSIGGVNWANCTEATLRGLEALWRVGTEGPPHMPELVATVNNIVHISHNGARLLTKFIPLQVFTTLGKCPSLGLGNPLVWEAWKAWQKISAEKSETIGKA